MENEYRRPEATSGEDGPERDATLNYLDKVHGGLEKAAQTWNRVFIVMMVLSATLLVISVGAASTTESFSLFGFKLEMSLPIFLAATTAVITVFVVSLGCLNLRESLLRNEVLRLYEGIGYYGEEHGVMTDELKSPFAGLVFGEALTAPAVSQTLSEKRYINVHYSLVTVTVVFAAFALPVVAEIAAIVRISVVVGWRGFWIWAPLAILVLFSIMALAAIYKVIIP